MSLSTEKSLRESLLVALSRAIGAAIQAQPFQCARNAWRALVAFPALFRSGGRLVEGWIVIEEPGQVTMNEHVWCELASGGIIDPSILLLMPETTSVFYFPGLTYTYAEAEALEGELFPHVRFDGLHGADGLGHPGYRAAREAARRKVYTLACARRPPKAMQFLTAQEMEEMFAPEAGTEADAPRTLVVEGLPLDLPRSREISRAIGAERHRCWKNARKALLSLPQELLTASYVEGWLVSQRADAIRVTEHGWIWTPRAGIVDPTLVFLSSPPSLVAYLPGVELSWLELQRYRTARLPLARVTGLQARAYHQACQQALDRAEDLAWQIGLPVLSEPGTTYRSVLLNGKLIGLAREIWPFPFPSPEREK
jgi:hypothetical protein